MPAMRRLLLILLSVNAGFVDTVGFLALHGLFTTHVTGNFVTLGASFALGLSGALAKVLALPLFCVVILLARFVGLGFDRLGWPALRIFFVAQALLLALGAWLAIALGPFPDGDAWPALATGGALVAGMAIQNAVARTRLSNMPPTTIMTGPTTQLMVDLADLMLGRESRAAARKRFGPTAAAVLSFAVGCALAALAYAVFREASLAAPPVLVTFALLALVLAERRDAKAAAATSA